VRRIGRGRRIGLAAAIATVAAAGAASERAAEAAGEDEESSCVVCHRDPDFLVTHPNLYQYYQDWQRSIHHEEGVTCSDCHGGHPEAAGREAAHAGMYAESSPESAVNFANVPATCGSCHGDVEEAYRESAHFEHLTHIQGEKGGPGSVARRGPSCVTCHRSMNTLTLDVTTVEATCAHCHDQDNHPEVPADARAALNKFLSIDRFERYVRVRTDPAQAREFLEWVDAQRGDLSVLWHTFELERIDAATTAILDALRARRDALRARGESREGSGQHIPPS